MSDDDDERVQQVIDALDPQPAHDVDWPISRRQTLRALAAAGLLGAGSGSASGESAGTVIADEAVFSNYGSEDVSDGWELTIDDEVFALTESDTETIELPDGGVGEEVIMPDGVEASEMIAPDGTVVFEDAILDSGEHQWRYEAGQGTTVEDNIGSLDLNFTSLSWGTEGFGGTAGVLDGTNDYAELSENDFSDLIDNAEATFFFWINHPDASGNNTIIAVDRPTSTANNFSLEYRGGFDDYRWSITLEDDELTSISGGSPSEDEDDWIVLAVSIGDGSQTLYRAQPPDYNVTEIGSEDAPNPSSGSWKDPPSVGRSTAGDEEYYTGTIDISFFDSKNWTESELQSFVDDTKSIYE